MTIELRHLRAFLAIAEEGTLTRAAGRLHLSQPALSRTLRQLEDHLGVRLADRSTHHLELTRAGQAFRLRAAAAISAVNAALDPRLLATWPLRLGHSWSAFGADTTTLLRRWQDEHPDVGLELLRVDDRTAGLLAGKVDVAVLRGPVTGVESVLLREEARVACLPADHALAAREVLTMADLAGQTIVVNPVSGITSADLWSTSMSTLPVANTDDWVATIAAGRGLGVTTTATPDLYPYPGVVYLPLSDGPPVPVHLAWCAPPSHPSVPDLVELALTLLRS
ncbi:LysR family transcriptional regulator [Pseudonocardiaceae bacterium YIM PH 21723]|nr:LysR family transcriptional regulator [Pseudonocardiaceae bacterium YIM PH 21723]